MNREVVVDDNEIHLYLADVESVTSDLFERYRAILSPEELERNERYRFQHSKNTDLLARAITRTTLSKYAPFQPEEWQFIKGEHGKPEIANPNVSLRFNLSHTRRYVALAVTKTFDIGVDIECIERNNDVLSIAEHYFAEQELNDLFQLPARSQEDRFFDYWTLKEAYMKARGEGLALGLGNFSFMLRQSKPITISFNQSLVDQAKDWLFWLSSLTIDHRLALAFRHRNQLNAKDQNVVKLTIYDVIPFAGNNDKQDQQIVLGW